MSSSVMETVAPAAPELDHGQQRINLILESKEVAALDLWIAMHPDEQISRVDAIKFILTRTILKQY